MDGKADLPAEVQQYTERLHGLPVFAAGAEQAGLPAKLRSAPEATSSGRVPILPVPGETACHPSPGTENYACEFLSLLNKDSVYIEVWAALLRLEPVLVENVDTFHERKGL
jgi:hypothetical protein